MIAAKAAVMEIFDTRCLLSYSAFQWATAEKLWKFHFA
jgi:hypothetical protein